MNHEARKAEMQKAIAEWKKKYHIGNNDPLLATLDLWEILMQDISSGEPTNLFRQELEKLTELAGRFTKQSGDIIVELRGVPKIKNDLWQFPYFTVLLVAVGALIIGIFIGKFILK
ncbi:MAG TPA: hypothetical protein VFV23_07560 [Verrucomicrobiae bacterium]|nr:hypothetical protein [Verrucomicrobiae bacterium]